MEASVAGMLLTASSHTLISHHLASIPRLAPLGPHPIRSGSRSCTSGQSRAVIAVEASMAGLLYISSSHTLVHHMFLHHMFLLHTNYKHLILKPQGPVPARLHRVVL